MLKLATLTNRSLFFFKIKRISGVGVVTQVRVKARRDRGGLGPKSKRGTRKREGDPITQTEDPITHDRGSHRDTALQHRECV